MTPCSETKLCSSSGLNPSLPHPVYHGPHRIKRLSLASGRDSEKNRDLFTGKMVSLLWGLVCFIGLLGSDTLGTCQQFDSKNLQTHTIQSLNPQASAQVPAWVSQHFKDARSFEQTSDKTQSAERFQEGRLDDYTVHGAIHQQQGTRPGVSTYQTQDRAGHKSRGGYPTLSWMKSSKTSNAGCTTVFLQYLSYCHFLRTCH